MVKKRGLGLLLVGAIAASASTAEAVSIRVDVETTGPVGLAPAFVAFHDGSYDIFNVGDVASADLELLAELGDPSALVGAAPAGVTAGGFAPGGPFAPNGGSGSAVFSVTTEQSSFSFASMVLPSNDYFVGTDNPINIASLVSGSNGDSVTVEFFNVYDAGTELEDLAFAPGGPLVGILTPSDPPGGVETAEPIAIVLGPDPFGSFANLPAGFDTTGIDFTNGSVARVTLTVVPEPATFGLTMLAGGALLMARRRSSKATA